MEGSQISGLEDVMPSSTCRQNGCRRTPESEKPRRRIPIAPGTVQCAAQSALGRPCGPADQSKYGGTEVHHTCKFLLAPGFSRRAADAASASSAISACKSTCLQGHHSLRVQGVQLPQMPRPEEAALQNQRRTEGRCFPSTCKSFFLSELSSSFLLSSV